MMIHYELLGTHPEVQPLQRTLPAVIGTWEQVRTHSAKHMLGRKIAQAAEHFYGLTLADFGSMKDLVSAMRGMDQHLTVS